MNNEFVTYEQALQLKELGFDEPCFGYYNVSNQELIEDLSNNRTGNDDSRWASAPLYQQAFRWFREVHNLRGFIGFRPNVKQFDYHIYDMGLSGMDYVKQRTMEEWNKDPLVGTYEEAELGCLKQLIKIIKTK